MSKKIRWFLSCFLMLLVFSSCEKNTLEELPKALQFENINFDSVLSFPALIDDKLICQYINGTTVDYVEITTSGEERCLGSIANFVVRMKQSVFVSPYLYLYVGAIPEGSDSSEVGNILVQLDVEDGKINSYLNADSSLPGISTYLIDNQIITVKNVVTDEKTHTFIESFNIESQDFEKYMECSWDNETRQGTAVYGICANQDNIFVLYDVCIDKNTIETYLVVLDKYFQQVDSILIDQETHDYVLTSFIADVQAFDNYIYITNASNYGYLGKIEDGKLISVFKGRNFEISLDPSGAAPIFYTRGTNQLFEINEEGELIKTEVSMGNNYTIQTVLSNEKNCCLICYADDCPKYAYLIDRNDIEKVNLACE